MAQTRFNILFSAIVSLILLLSLLKIFFGFSGILLKLEILGLLFLMALTFVGLFSGCGKIKLFFMSIFSLFNLLLIWEFLGNLYLWPLFLSALLFAVNYPKKEGCCSDCESQANDSTVNLSREQSISPTFAATTSNLDHSEVFTAQPKPQVVEINNQVSKESTAKKEIVDLKPAPVKKKAATKKPAVKKKAITKKVKTSKAKKSVSKKYVASSRSKLYHDPKCEWAKKINPKGKLTFAKKEDAWEKGLRAHECVK